MNLLLLLSALLSAITGATVSGRAPQAMTELASVATRTAAAAEVRNTVRPVATLPTLSAVAAAPHAVGAPLSSLRPIYGDRRRE